MPGDFAVAKSDADKENDMGMTTECRLTCTHRIIAALCIAGFAVPAGWADDLLKTCDDFLPALYGISCSYINMT